MTSNPNIQYYKNTQVEYAEPLNDVVIKVGCNDLTDKGIVLDYDLVGVPKRFKINPGGMNWTDGINTFNTNLDKLCALEIALPALQVAPNPTTIKFNDTILLDNGGGNTLTMNPTSLICSNNMLIDSGTAIDLDAEESITLTSNLLYNINLDAPNVNSTGFSMPICFTRQRTDTFTYSLGGQTFDMMYQTSCQIPQEFISLNPSTGYTSTYWKIDFALNCFQFSNPTDKGIGCYIDFIDAASNIYTPITYNANTPFSYDKRFGYSSGANPPFMSFNWTDIVDFSSLVNTGTAYFPLDVRLYFAADAALSTQFNMLITLTRTNLI